MMRKTMVLAGLTVLCVVAGCADERAPVNRVQPYALKKSYFVGEKLQDPSDDPEFWAQATLIDVGYGAAQEGLFTSTFAQPVTRIRWQITEDLLLGRLAYERIQGSDGKGGAGRATEDGVIVVAYPIESHFDIERQYNPTTGEQINVLEENTTDRPWYEREYMRVDWSKNMNVDSYDFDMLSLLGVYGAYQYSPLAYDVTDPDDPNAPMFDLDHGYFDVTNKAFAAPLMVDISSFGWGLNEVPSCWFEGDFQGGSFPWGNCNPVEMTVRQAFRKVEDRDFQPEEWDGYKFQAYGGFYQDRFGYSRNYRMTDDNWHRLLNHHNIWQRAHYYADPDKMTGPIECYTPTTTPYGADPHRDADHNGTEDECEAAGPGSHCDTFTQKCTLPYAQRQTRTIAAYYTNGSNPDYFEPSAEAEQQWDVALRTAVRAAQLSECEITGGDPDTCQTKFPMWHGQMDDYQDAIWLAAEVDKCRNGWAYPHQDCMALADSLGNARSMDPAVISVAKMPEMIVLCHSPVEATDAAACGGPRLPAGTTSATCQAAYDAPGAADPTLLATCRAALNVRIGDMRYNQVNGIKAPQTLSPWGIYTDSVDPLTGEVIAASTNVWTYYNDVYSQGIIDKIRLLKGELQVSDVTEGTYVHDWAVAAQAASGGAMPLMTRDQVNERLARFGGPSASPSAMDAPMSTDLRRQVQEMNHALEGVEASADAASTNAAVYSARRQAAAGTQFEAELMTPEVQQLEGVDGLPIDESVMQAASPLRGGNPEIRLQLKQLRELALARRGACIMDTHEAEAPFSIMGLADMLEAKFGAFNPRDSKDVQQARADKMRLYLARRTHLSVIAHEMGHSMGLRHNFVGSADAYEYRPQYWQLRTRDGSVTEECTDLAADGNTCVGPRWFDPVTDEERENLIWMWATGSIMDYPGEYTTDTLGPDVWDFAGVRMFYGGTVAVNANPDFNLGTPKGRAMLDKMDNFGGILGIHHAYDENGDGVQEDFHYSQLQNKYGMISDCTTVDDPELYKPAGWDEVHDGTWSPLFDGLMVNVDGQWTKCKQPPVEYVPWTAQRFPTTAEAGQYYRGGPSIDPQGRTRIPYGFASDNWADLGNVFVYRQDSGADAYEIFNFLLSTPEVWQIFDTYRRHNTAFSVAGIAGYLLERYYAKVRDGVKGLGLIKNIYEDYALESRLQFDTLWPVIARTLPDNVVGAGLAFDNFTRQLDRPEIGPHFYRPYENVLRSSRDTVANPGATQVIVPNGIADASGAMTLGGKLVENQLATDEGDYNSWYTINEGSYYDKMNAAMLMTESVDNFISESRNDFVDPRYRSVSVADLFPEGYRRWLANNLTGDDMIKGPRVTADDSGTPLVDFTHYPKDPLGWTSWWTDTPQICFANARTNVCSAYGTATSDPFQPMAPDHTAVLDPQVGWEQQKFLIAWTMLYLPENERTTWLDMMRLYDLGTDADPGFDQRIEFHSPNGKIYVAKTFGTEIIFGEVVQKGVAARVLEWANHLLALAYETDPGPDMDGDGNPDWPELHYATGTGQPIVKYDPTISPVDDAGNPLPAGVPGCDATDDSACTCSSNRYCMALQRYLSVPAYLREAVTAYQLGEPSPRGVY